mgnify:CR=1 FL=1
MGDRDDLAHHERDIAAHDSFLYGLFGDAEWLKKQSAADLKVFHQGLTFKHGNLTCVSCHNPSDGYQSLRLADGTLAGADLTMTAAIAYLTGHVGFVAEHPETLEPAWLGTQSKRPEGLSFSAPLAHALRQCALHVFPDCAASVAAMRHLNDYAGLHAGPERGIQGVASHRFAAQRAFLQVARVVLGIAIPLAWMAILQPDLDALLRRRPVIAPLSEQPSRRVQ